MRRIALIWVLVAGLAVASTDAGANLAACPESPLPTSFQPHCGLNLRLDIRPACPAPGDEVEVIAAGEWRDSCVPTYLLSGLFGQVVRVEAVLDYPANTGCLCVITPWQLSDEVGRLPQGVYRLDLYTRDMREPGMIHHCASKWFAVGSELHLLYLPAIVGSSASQAGQGSRSSGRSAGDPLLYLSAPRASQLGLCSGR